jgi:hypothetical protein
MAARKAAPEKGERKGIGETGERAEPNPKYRNDEGFSAKFDGVDRLSSRRI